ncbi:MAG: MlaE family lipid ABC transporter permease subunit [Labilithrix sp.]|nr:MlaE family lipid ABC transporter permease subunit [Labilithrix sp.]MCW5815243.1 MlaE family lipid ABC transporter permease subunit [Labilithrix sp.]
MDTETERPSFEVEPKGSVIRLAGRLRMPDAPALWKEVRAATDEAKKGSLTIDLSDATAIDGGVMSLLVALRTDLHARGVKAEIEGTPEQFLPLVELYEAKKPPQKRKTRKPEGLVENVGRATSEVGSELSQVISFFGEMVIAAVGLVRHPRSGHWKEIPPLVNKAGADALPIVVLINFLVGFVMAYQSAKQLKQFGANVYVADLVGLSVTRELAPLMTAIIVCGRSGAAFAAEIGSMKVSEEVDALRTLGLRPFSWLVLPRVLALMIVTPLLTVIGDIIGVLGGLFVAVTSLDITPRGYLIETQKAMELWDVQHGVCKSFAFALAIGLIACQQGFAASGGAEGVGRRTTSTVVASLFALVVLDALFTVVFRFFGL